MLFELTRHSPNSNAFSAQIQVISKKKKKRSSPNLKRISRPNSKIQTLFQVESRHLLRIFGTQIPLGGVFNFSAKIGFKSTKNVRFCILYRPMGGSRAPPGYTTVYTSGVPTFISENFNPILFGLFNQPILHEKGGI